MLAYIIRNPYLKGPNSFETSGNLSGNFIHAIFFLLVNFHNIPDTLYNFSKYSKLWNHAYLTELELFIWPYTADLMSSGSYLSSKTTPYWPTIHLFLAITFLKKALSTDSSLATITLSQLKFPPPEDGLHSHRRSFEIAAPSTRNSFLL